MRQTRVVRMVRAGCFVCHDGKTYWEGKNAQGVAAKHHDKTGHATWVEINMAVYYGKEKL